MKSIVLFVCFVIISISCHAQLAPIPSGVYNWADARVTKGAGYETHEFMKGLTAETSFFEIHATTLYKGSSAPGPNTQKDIEEFIFVKEGRMRVTVGPKTTILGKYCMLLMPPQQMHAIQNAGDSALTYYTLEFRSKKTMDLARSVKAGGALLVNADTLVYHPSAVGGAIQYLQRPTAMLDELEMHMTELKHRGPSHPPHTHIDTELILMLSGHTQQLINGKTYQGRAGDMYLMNSNELHGISNVEDTPCKYLAIRWK